jgi:RNA polymerase sigma factor (sigma-70 family)
MTSTSLAPTVRHIRRSTLPADAEGTDAQLLHAFATHHDEAAFTQIVRRHGPTVLGVCRRVLRHSHDAEDVFQATFLVLARKAGSIRKGEALAGWLHGVSYRIALRARRAAARRRKHEARARPGEPAAPGSEIAWREVQELLDEEVGRLPPAYRDAFVLCCLEGHSQADAARRLGIKEGTLSSRMTRARKRLQEALARRGIRLSAVLAALALAGGARAALPGALANRTTGAALRFAGGSASGLPEKVHSLAQGAIQTMLATKVKRAAVWLLLSLALLGVGGTAVSQRDASAREPEPAAPHRPKPKPKAEGESAARPTVTGTVLDPEGTPVKGAKLYVSADGPRDRAEWKARATTGADGGFRLTVSEAEIDHNEVLVAVAEGHAPDWVGLRKADTRESITLRLVKDVPIAGRVLDLEGRPVAGATVRVLGGWKFPGEDLTPLVKDLQAKPGDRNTVGRAWVKHQQAMTRLSVVPGVPGSVTTGADGRFRLARIGRERVVILRIEGPDIAQARLSVLTRPGLKGLPRHTHGATFNHVAGPTKPIRGVVKDKRTGKPLAGLFVGGQPDREDGPGEGVFTKTDAEGRFTLRGLPKAKSYSLSAGAVPYITGLKEVADTPGLEAIRVDFTLERALALRVRVTDRDTGRPVRAYVQYSIRRGNPSLDDYPSYPRNAVGWDMTDKSGWNTQTVLPGPGLIAVQAIEGEYTRAQLAETRGSHILHDVIPSVLAVSSYHAVLPISPDEKDPKSLVLEVALDPGRSVSGRVVGPDGKPLAGATVAGLTAVKKVSERTSDKLPGSTFTARGLDPRHPRTLLFFHEKEKVGGVITLRGDERGPQTVRLGSLGTVTGRLVDRNGKPVAGADVWLPFARASWPTLPGELAIGGIGTIRETVKVAPVKTDARGRFRLAGLVPGMPYDLKAGRRGEELRRDLRVTAGKEVDLGDLAGKPAATSGEKK